MQADLVLEAKRCFQCGLWILRSGYTPGCEHFYCQQQQCPPTHAFGKCVFLPCGPKYTFQSGVIMRVHLKVPGLLYSPKTWARRNTWLWLCWVLWYPRSLIENIYRQLKIPWNKLFQAVCRFGLHYRLLFLRVKHGKSHSLPVSAALSLPVQPALSFINQFQRLEHWGCALLDVLSSAAALQPSRSHRQCKSPILCLFFSIP